MAEAENHEEELVEKDTSDNQVLNKYRDAGIIAQDVLEAVYEKSKETADVIELCAYGDQLITQKTENLYKKDRLVRGVAFPTCISKNEIAGHFQPIENPKEGDAATLKDGDLVKLDLGVHIDGFAALAATSFLYKTESAADADEKKQKVLQAALTASECAIRMMKPGTKNTELTEMFQKVSEEFDCQCLEGVLSHELRQYVIDGENTILSKSAPERQVEEFELEPNKVYAIDIVMSSGTGKGQRKEIYDTTIYKRVVENSYQLRAKTSRALLKEINSKYPTYPFSLRNFTEKANRTRAGLKECMNHELLADYPVLHEKEGEFVAQFKFTCVVRPGQGPLKLCGTGPDFVAGLPKKEIKDASIAELLKSSWESKKRKKRKRKKKKK